MPFHIAFQLINRECTRSFTTELVANELHGEQSSPSYGVSSGTCSQEIITVHRNQNSIILLRTAYLELAESLQ
jgi:hypothetical protein